MKRSDWNASAAALAEADSEFAADTARARRVLRAQRRDLKARGLIAAHKPQRARRSLRQRLGDVGDICAGYAVIGIFWALATVAKHIGPLAKLRR